MPLSACPSCQKQIAVSEDADQAICPFCLHSVSINGEPEQFVEFDRGRRRNGGMGFALFLFHVCFFVLFAIGVAMTKAKNPLLAIVCASGAICCAVFGSVIIGSMFRMRAAATVLAGVVFTSSGLPIILLTHPNDDIVLATKPVAFSENSKPEKEEKQ